jgi:hypothetical protein
VRGERRIVDLVPVLVALALAAALIAISEMHSWSSSATTWGLVVILGAPTVIDLSVWRRRKRSARHRDGGGGAAHPSK